MTTAEQTDNALDQAAKALLTPEAYTVGDRIHDAARLLRKESPIRYVEHPDHHPLWVLTRHADIMEVESHQNDWLQGGRAFLQTKVEIERIERGEIPYIRALIDLDGEEHRTYRAITQKWFTVRNLNRLGERINVLAKRAVDRMEQLGDTCDFAQDIAMHFPFETIMSMLGLPEEDYPLLLDLSSRVLGSDPDGVGFDPASDEFANLVGQYVTYFGKLTEDRKANPTEDLASVIANAQLPGGNEMPFIPDMIGYYLIFATAGHETTSSSMSGGVLALTQHPDQLDRLRKDPNPQSIRTAADEIIRWVTPLKHFCRVAAGPYKLGDTEFQAGDRVFMSYASANRDESVFDEPFTFDLTRKNAASHLAFGFGAHYCLGAELARMQIRALLTELVPRLESIEIDGPIEYMKAIQVSGPKRLPLRYKLRPATA